MIAAGLNGRQRCIDRLTIGCAAHDDRVMRGPILEIMMRFHEIAS
jgi:hypothetical protein